MKVFLMALVVALALGHSASMQEPSTPAGRPVVVTHNGRDRVGTTLAYEIREVLRRSAGYPLVEDGKDAILQIVLTTLDLDCSGTGHSSAVSVTLLVNNEARVYLRGALYLVGRNRAESIAREIVADLDRVIGALPK